MLTVKLHDQDLQHLLTQWSQRLSRPRGLAAVLGREGVTALKQHYRGLERRRPNKLGGERQHFWRAVADSVNQPSIDADGRRIVIGISHPAIAQKVFGGTIVAKRAKALTIPVSKEAYGRTTRTFEHETGKKLFRITVGKGDLKLVGLLATRQEGSEVAEIHYVLRRSVFQSPDPDALPPEGEFTARLVRRARTYLARVAADMGGSGPVSG